MAARLISKSGELTLTLLVFTHTPERLLRSRPYAPVSVPTECALLICLGGVVVRDMRPSPSADHAVTARRKEAHLATLRAAGRLLTLQSRTRKGEVGSEELI